MQAGDDNAPAPALVQAISSACETAKWEAVDLVARSGRHRAPDLLRERSAELASSPVGYDQLLSLALAQVASALDERAIFLAVDLMPLLRPIHLPRERQARIRQEARALSPDEISGLCDDARAQGDAAVLGHLLWREARLLADDRTRAAMLALASMSADRAEPKSAGGSIAGAAERIRSRRLT